MAIATAIPFAQKHYYGNPYLGCEKGEANVSVTGVPGLACMPKCNTVPGYDCTPDKASDVTAMPECIIGINSSTNNYCALICNTEAKDNQCDVKGGASCHHVSGNQGVCTYPPPNATLVDSAPSPAPDNWILDLHTDVDGVGVVSINVTRDWAPLGVDHLHALVKDGFYDGAAFFRVVGGFVLQFGIAGTPEENTKWKTPIKDDPVKHTNAKWTVTYATAGPNTRTTQLFINYKANPSLDAQGFAPLGVAVAGTQYLDRVHDPTPGDSGGVNQDDYLTKGDTWIRTTYPEINFIKKAEIRSALAPEVLEVPEVTVGVPNFYHKCAAKSYCQPCNPGDTTGTCHGHTLWKCKCPAL